jgi:hypothetical protein
VAPGDNSGLLSNLEQSPEKGIEDEGALEKGYDSDWASQEANNRETLARTTKPEGSNGDIKAGDRGKKRKPGSKDKPQPRSPLEKGRRRWLVITSIGVLILAMLGIGGYFGYDYYRTRTTNETTTAKASSNKGVVKTITPSAEKKTASAMKSSPTVAAKDKAKTTPDKPKTAASTKDKSAPTKSVVAKEAAPAKEEPVEPIIKARDEKVIRISAARLSAELAANAAANEKYKGALLEVSGIYAKTEPRETVRPPKRPHIVFACEGPQILGDTLHSRTPPEIWARLVRQRPCTIRGVYGSDGVLHSCDLMSLTPPADTDYKGKELEVTGYVAQFSAADRTQPFPRILLESSTNAVCIVECLFRKSDEDKLLTISVDAPVIIRGTSGGRIPIPGAMQYLVRLDNCDLLETSAPPKDRLRLDAIQLAHAYEEDLRPAFHPPPMLSTQIDPPVPLAQLEAEFALDPFKWSRKYQDKTVTVEGLNAGRSGGGNTIRVNTGSTNALVGIECRFSSRAQKDLDAGPQCRIRGFCSGMADVKTLVLENCEALDRTGNRFTHRLSADYLPHAPGRTLTYDVAQHPATGGRPQAARLRFELKENGLVETVTTHIGYLRSSLFEPGEGGKWTSSAGARKVKLPGPKFRLRVFGGYVQLGQFDTGQAGADNQFYEPVLKLGARVGESWRWSHANAVHEYKIVKFDHYQAQPSVIVEETVAGGQDPHHPTEIQHIYVRGVGEVERRDYLRLTSKERRLLAERKLVDEPRPSSESAPTRPAAP